ncbi:PREDICTED: uncharacterized protein LOC107349059 isoform X1 [Acropora digitifera]|uniref:uncharacterized protein LOC107349059 isoform X1 n=1 Tax=Acropora digitifera TaxID=70779 RepID=UPI00077AF3F5|nr:PREDICTED: uncharacterized protein LOC107349059 isoform X1 [Acropora digitifera]
MEKKRERNDLTPITTCISPLWKDTTTNNVVTLRMPPPQTQLTSLDTFMAAHSPRRFCQARQKYILKPLTVDKRITEAGYVPVQQKTRNYSENTRSTTVHHQKQRPVLTQRIPQVNTSSNFVTDSSSEGENRVLRLGKCKLNNEFFSKESSAELYKSSYFRPGPKIPFSFSRSTSIPTMLNGASDLIAIGTIPMASQRQTPPKPMSRSSSEEDIQPITKSKQGALLVLLFLIQILRTIYNCSLASQSFKIL